MTSLQQHPSTSSTETVSFSLPESFLEKFKDKQPVWGPVGYVTYKRTYARPLADGSTEEFWQTVQRVVEGTYAVQKRHCINSKLPWNEEKAIASAQEMYERMWAFKFLPPGRGLWTMGTDILDKKGGSSLNNCSFISTANIDRDFAEPFLFLMDMSMLGVGVGADLEGKGKTELHQPDIIPLSYTVEDSREGWLDALKTVLDAFVLKSPLPKTFDFRQVRPKGAPLKGFGGVASGPEPLIDLIKNVIRLLCPYSMSVEFEAQSEAVLHVHPVFFRNLPKSYLISSSQIVDLFNYIGKCVVSGGIRRTAELMLGQPDDAEFLALKQDQEALYSHRWASNNSVVGHVGMNYEDIVFASMTNGEPGIVYLNNCRAFSRTNDPANWKDVDVAGVNPCGEITLHNYELCTLVETFPANHTDWLDYQKTLKYAYLYGKTVTLVSTHNPKTNAVMAKNRRIGCSMSGIVQAMEKFGRRNFLINFCDAGYRYITELDRKYSQWLGIPMSIKMTSVKPSGSVSLLTTATPGIHFAHSEYYIRNIRIQDTSPLLSILEKANYPIEPDAYSKNTMVVSFPVKEENFRKGKRDVSVWEQFANVADMQAYWSDNAVSATITVKSTEKDDYLAALQHFESRLKAVSVLPLNDSDHGYVQAPYIEITKEQYEQLASQIKPLVLGSFNAHDKEDKFCDGDSCTI